MRVEGEKAYFDSYQERLALGFEKHDSSEPVDVSEIDLFEANEVINERLPDITQDRISNPVHHLRGRAAQKETSLIMDRTLIINAAAKITPLLIEPFLASFAPLDQK